MELHVYGLVLLALGVVAMDYFIRVRRFSSRRDQSVQSLLGMMVPVHIHSERDSKMDASLETPVANSLLKYFEQSFVSRHIVAALAETPKGMTERELERHFAEVAGSSGKRTLPSSAIRSVLMVLISAEFVIHKAGRIEMTDLGRALHAILKIRQVH